MKVTFTRGIRDRVPRWTMVSFAAAALIFATFAATTSPVRADDSGIESLRSTGKAFASVAKKVSGGVVFIQVEKKMSAHQPAQFFFGGPGQQDNPWGGNDFLHRFFGIPFGQGEGPSDQMVVGQGSGFIVSDKGDTGYILTNNHVVGDADEVKVTLEDGRVLDADIVGTDPHSDVAVIKVKADSLRVLPLGDSDKLEVGEWVVAVGSPFGLSHTITSGIVSAKGRSSMGITDYEDFIQTDAAINPGNSGGPLLNLDGEVVGMNTAIVTRSGGNMGIGLAIPIDMAKTIMNQLIDNGKVTRGYLGIVIQDLTPDLAQSFKLGNVKGILVAQVTSDSPAEKAGVESGDVITRLDGQPVEKISEFRNKVSLTAPGTQVDLTVLRHGKEKAIDVKIGELTDDVQVAENGSFKSSDLGLEVQTLTPELSQQFNIQDDHGVVVTRVESGSTAEWAGIHPGALILEVNREPVRDAESFRQAVAHSEGTVLLLVKEGQMSRYVALKTK
jgi:serine protease Do